MKMITPASISATTHMAPLFALALMATILLLMDLAATVLLLCTLGS